MRSINGVSKGDILLQLAEAAGKPIKVRFLQGDSFQAEEFLSSSLYWGEGVSRPFVKHTSIVGSQFLPGVPWYLDLKDKNVEHCRTNGMAQPSWLALTADRPSFPG